MKLTLGFSPCPNDTFIFDALVNQKIDTGDFEFDVKMEDVETLNQWAFEGKLDITKLSFPAFFANLDQYALLNSGAALGKGVGPLLITNKEQEIRNDDVNALNVLLPGKNTTAHLLFSFAYPEAVNKNHVVFSEIEDALLQQKADLGVIIHENRFTYRQKGLVKVADLGTYWENKTGVPIPLGGIAIKKTVEKNKVAVIDTLIRKSIKYAFTHYPSVSDYVKKHSQTMSEDVMRQHIDLYVNDYSINLGDEGRQAIRVLQKVFLQLNNTAAGSFSSSEMFV